MGALCTKTLNAISRVKKLIKFFKSWFSVVLLTQRMRKSCIQSKIFSLGGQYYGLGLSTVEGTKSKYNIQKEGWNPFIENVNSATDLAKEQHGLLLTFGYTFVFQ